MVVEAATTGTGALDAVDVLLNRARKQDEALTVTSLAECIVFVVPCTGARETAKRKKRQCMVRVHSSRLPISVDQFLSRHHLEKG